MQLELDRALSEGFQKVGDWILALVRNLPDLLAAAVVLVLFALLARGTRAAVKKLMDRATDHGPVKSLVGTVAYLLVLAAGFMIALGILDLDRTVTSLLAGVGIITLALAFAFQDLAENFIAGVMMSVRHPFTDGDLIRTNDYLGIVETVDLRTTTVRLLTGEHVRIPNAEVYGNPVVNYSVSGGRRVDVACGVSYTQDLEQAAAVALDAVAGVAGRDESREPELYWKEFGDSSIDFVVRFWIHFTASNAAWLKARSDAMVALKKAFDESGVGIPYPILTLDFDDVGGRTLGEEIRAPVPGSD